MAVVSDFIQIIGDTSQNIPIVGAGAQVALPDFNTGGRRSDKTALLIFSVRNKGGGNSTVRINGNNVGSITPTSGAFWSTQLIAVSGDQLNDGNNEIVVENVGDAFDLKDLICFFHQEV